MLPISIALGLLTRGAPSGIVGLQLGTSTAGITTAFAALRGDYSGDWTPGEAAGAVAGVLAGILAGGIAGFFGTPIVAGVLFGLAAQYATGLFVEHAIDDVYPVLSNVARELGGLAQDVISAGINAIDDVYNAAVDAVSNYANSLSGVASDILDEVSQYLGDQYNDLLNAAPDWLDALGDIFNSFNFDPLVIDLDGDGIELTALNGSTARFDLDGDGFAEQTGWVSPDDALLAIDLNGNGKIDDISELFGSDTQTGYEELAAYDSNGFVQNAVA